MPSLTLALWIHATLVSMPLVAIDAGHGGEQDGAVGVCGAKEKDVTLAVSLELARVLEATGRVRTLLTRSGDETVELLQRAQLANASEAALFLSIHANSGVTPGTHGVETFFLSRNGSDKRTERLVLRENEGVNAAGMLARSSLDKMLRGMSLNASHQESQRLATRIQGGLPEALETRARAVLQAPFLVLVGAQMAAALVEIGFLTNAQECSRLATPEYQARVAAALAAAVIAHLDGEATLADSRP